MPIDQNGVHWNTDTEINLFNSGYVPPPTPPFTGLPLRLDFDTPNDFALSIIEKPLQELVKRVIAAEEATVEGLLRQAFFAGGEGLHPPQESDFEQWLADVKERLLDD